VEVLRQTGHEGVVDARRVGAVPLGVLQGGALGVGEAGVRAIVGDRAQQLLGDPGVERHLVAPRLADGAVVDEGDAHPNELVEAPVERAAPDGFLPRVDGGLELRTQGHGPRHLGPFAGGDLDSGHAAPYLRRWRFCRPTRTWLYGGRRGP